MQLVYKTVFSIKDTVVEMIPKFGELKDQAMEVRLQQAQSYMCCRC